MLARLSLTDFRSYPDLKLEPGPGLVILTGENGAGKTNILEAVSLLAPGRGLRGASLADMARRDGPGGFAVAGQLETPSPPRGEGWGEGERASSERLGQENNLDRRAPSPNPLPAGERACTTLGTGTLANAPDRRLVRINTVPAAANSLSEWLSILWLTPAMDRLFIEGASGRRRFLDRLTLALYPGHAAQAARYDAAMRARNKLLAEERPDAAWLDALEARMSEHGAELARARTGTVTALAERLAAAPEGPFARAAIAIEGGDPAPDLRAARTRDAAAGRTLAGPHRADLAVTHAGKDQPASLSSTGEQKALLLGIILAHAELVRARGSGDQLARPLILLLDEVAAHLDPTRRAALFARLADTGGQVWMTGTEPALFAAVPAGSTRFQVVNGHVRQP